MARRGREEAADLGDDRRQHLQFLQDTIKRMADNSALAKGWSLTIIVAALAYAWTNHEALVALMGVLAAVLFTSVDARYLLAERRFRALFRAAAAGRVAVYEMDVRAVAGMRDLVATCTWRRTIWSWTVAGFHGWIVLGGVAITAWLHFRC